MDFIYLLAVTIIVFLLFLKYREKINQLKKENYKLKKQLEAQKCNDFNTSSSINVAKQKETD
ncbi:MAG: hypothetical protein WC422_02540 [Candidatus Paceibacterota bacterium]|jgi:hypothetical protein